MRRWRDPLIKKVVRALVNPGLVDLVRKPRHVARREREPNRPFPCAVRVTGGVHDGLGTEWRRAVATVAPGRIDLGDIEIRVRRIDESGPGSHRLPMEQEELFIDVDLMWVLLLHTDHAVCEWAIPQTDLEWVVPLVAGRGCSTPQDRPADRP